MLLGLTDGGLCCEAGGFYIDPWQPVARAVITHAHADHARTGSRRYLTASEGKQVLRLRLGAAAMIETAEYGRPVFINGVRVSFHPAGHILGSTQVRVEYQGTVLFAYALGKAQRGLAGVDAAIGRKCDMREKFLPQITTIIAAVVGAVPAFFVVFNVIFSDVFLLSERLMSFVLVVVVYTVLGIVFGFLSPTDPWKLGFWLSFPAILIVIWYSTRETGQLLLHLVYLVLVIGSAVFGAYVGSRLRVGQRGRARGR